MTTKKVGELKVGDKVYINQDPNFPQCKVYSIAYDKWGYYHVNLLKGRFVYYERLHETSELIIDLNMKKKVKDLQIGDVFLNEIGMDCIVCGKHKSLYSTKIYHIDWKLKNTKDIISQEVDAEFEVTISQPFKGILPVNYDELQPNEELVTHADIKVGDKCRFSKKSNYGYAYPEKEGEYFTVTRIENSKFTDKEVKLYGPTKYTTEDLISVGWVKSIIRYKKPYNYKELQKDEVFVNIEDVKVGDKIRCCDLDYPGDGTYYEVTHVKGNSITDWYTLYSLGHTSGGGDSCGHGKRVMVKSVKKLDQTILDIAAKLNISLTKEIEKEEIVKKMVKVTVDKTEQELRNEIKSKL